MYSHIREYYSAVCKAFQIGNIESSYFRPIIALFTLFGCTVMDLSGERGGRTGENVDLKIWRTDEIVTEAEPFAAIEVKKIEGIDKRARSQVKTSAARYGNLILTDNLVWEFWHGEAEKMYAGVRLIEKNGDKLELREDNIELFISLVQDFMLKDPVQIRSSNKLAEYMAIHAKTIRSVITGILKDDGTGQPLTDERQKNKVPMFPELFGLYGKIKAELRPHLTSRSFADMYAQTIVYGLFIARYNDAGKREFDRYKAIESCRKESHLLNRFFNHIASTGKTHPTLETVIDKLCVLYRTCDLSALLDQDAKRDTIVHFYEDFLTHYDPELRKSMGVFYTPTPVVRYLVSMVDRILVEDFGIKGGLSNNEGIQIKVPSEQFQEGRGKKWRKTRDISVPKVAILDPACGTGTFAAEIIKHIKNTYFGNGREAFYRDYIQDEKGLLSRLVGFEIMMTSYVVAHLKIRRAISETLGYAPKSLLPAKVYLTNTLSIPNATLERVEQMRLFDFSAAITDEAYNADTWKTRLPIKVIMGNPPYLVASTTPYDITAYRFETDGKTKLKERNSKMLGDDYVKFFKFAQEIINKHGEGVLAFVSPHGYLSNSTFRGMRASLLRTFDKIFVIDLHGNSNLGEISPDGSADENVFDIKQGVALFIGVKTTNNCDWAEVFHADVWGKRENKFRQLHEGNIQFSKVKHDNKFAYFISIGNDNKDLYETGINVRELFPVNVFGAKSGNDKVAYSASKDELNCRLDIIRNALDEKNVLEMFHKFTRDQTFEKIQDDVVTGNGYITPIDYRPFDRRWTYYTGKSGGWMDMPREKKVMGHLIQNPTTPIGKNIGLVFGRSAPVKYDFAMIFISDTLIDLGLTGTVDKGYIAPLYLKSISSLNGQEWVPNFDKEQLKKLTQNLLSPSTPIEIFDYVYAVLHDPVYREKYNEFLKRDFPRVPVIESEEMFRAYTAAGERLRKLHLMQEKITASLKLEPNTATDLEIGTIRYKDGILHLNSSNCITGIPVDVWNYRIGGYQVIEKWLKSHKGSVMTANDFDHINNIVGLLAETIKIQENLKSLHKKAN